MAYEEYLLLLGELEDTGRLVTSRDIALWMEMDIKVASATLGKLFRMDMAQRKTIKSGRRGRPAFGYTITRRGRTHLAWLQGPGIVEANAMMREIIMRPSGWKWTREWDARATRAIRRAESEETRKILRIELEAARLSRLGQMELILELIRRKQERDRLL